MLKRINKNLTKLVSEGVEVEMVRGGGYHYFIYSDVAKNIYETESHYVYYTSHLSYENWMEKGAAFINRMVEKIAEKEALDAE